MQARRPVRQDPEAWDRRTKAEEAQLKKFEDANKDSPPKARPDSVRAMRAQHARALAA